MRLTWWQLFSFAKIKFWLADEHLISPRLGFGNFQVGKWTPEKSHSQRLSEKYEKS